jgi:hypothetical protein
MNKALISAVAAIMLILSATASAQEQQTSFKALIGKGFDVKSAVFVKGETTENREVFVVTLQREKSVAVCYFAATSWINLSPQALDDVRRCDVR